MNARHWQIFLRLQSYSPAIKLDFSFTLAAALIEVKDSIGVIGSYYPEGSDLF